MRSRSGPDRADEVFKLLFAEGGCSPSRAAEKLGMTGSQIEETVRYLAAMGLVRPSREGMLPTPVPPETAFALLLHTAEQTTADRLDGLRSLRAAFTALADNLPAFQESGDARLSRMEVHAGPQRIAERKDAMVAKARREILALRPNDRAAQERWDEAVQRGVQVLERGVSLRTIHLHSTPENPLGYAYLRGLRHAGAQVRLAMTLPFRLTLVDDIQALVTLSSDSAEASALEIHGAPMCRLLRQVFEHCWVYAARLSDCAPGAAQQVSPEAALTDRERMVLKMFAAGLKDSAIARNLGVSDRTLRRTITPLLAKLGAGSRFQAGMTAVERGLVSAVELAASG